MAEKNKQCSCGHCHGHNDDKHEHNFMSYDSHKGKHLEEEILNNEKGEKVEYILQGLNCASCADKIQRRIANLEEVKAVNYNFATTTLTVKMDKPIRSNIFEKVKDIVVSLEPHVKVIEKREKKDIQVEYENVEIKDKKKTNRIIKFTIGVVALIIGVFLKNNSYSYIPFLISYIVIGGDIILRSYNNIKKGEIFDENFLMTIASITAMIIKQYPEAIMVMLLYQIGEYFQGKAVESSRKSISELMDIRPEYANLLVNGDTNKVSPEKVNIGDLIIVKPGEKVPLDGIVVQGTSSVDTKALTGESVPQDVEKNSEITSGFINIDGLLKIKVTKSFKNSAVSKILDLVQNASAKKATTELKITKFARIYTPIVVGLAVVTAVLPPLIGGGDWFTWVKRAATFLVVSCPCAFVISIPMTYFAGLGASSKKGVLVKGGNYLESLSNAKIAVFDKTGTLTKGNFKVSEIYTTGKYSKEDILKYTAYGESFSTHPIAISIVSEFNENIDKNIIKEYKEIKGKGIEAKINDIKVTCGNLKFLKDKGVDIKEVTSIGTVVYTCINGEYAGHIVIEDEIKKDSKKGVAALINLGIEKIVMLTGDRKLTAKSVAKEIGITDYKYELLPQDKVTQIEKLMRSKGEKESLIFVGDGINDAPVLARADIGIAMGGVGSDAAIEAADVVIMNDEPSKIGDAIKVARKTKKIVNQNIILSLGIKGAIIILAALGIANMMLAVFGDVGVTLIAVFNAMRVLK